MKQNNFSLDALSPVEMAKKAEDVGVYKATKDPKQAFLLAITAGVFIAIAFVFYTTVTTGSSDMPYGMAKFIGGLAFSLGLILVVLTGGELFTSSVLSTVARASGRINTKQMLRHWVVVYLGNLIGALIFVIAIWVAGQHLTANGQWGLNVLNIAQHKLHHSFGQAVVLGLLCNLLVCMATWMSYAGRSVTDKVIVMLLPVAMFVASGFEHSIANMFMIPMGIVIHTFATPDFWITLGIDPKQFADLTVHHFVFNNLIPVTLGNLIGGGVVVGLTYWQIHLRVGKPAEAKIQNPQSTTTDTQ